MRVLRWAIATPARYIAMIGSKRKTIAVVKELEKEGIPREAFDRIYAPMGLEIGADHARGDRRLGGGRNDRHTARRRRRVAVRRQVDLRPRSSTRALLK